MVASWLVAPAAQAQTTYDVQVGAFHGQEVPAETMAFLPGRVKVHQGDTLRFGSESFHTATLLPAGVERSDWLEANAAKPGDPFFLFEPDPDDGPAAMKYNFDVLLPSDMACGPQGSPCSYTGSLLSSGIPLEGPMDWNVQVNSAPGTSFWAVCLIHQQMNLRVQVVPNAEPASDPQALQNKVAQDLNIDRDDALALHNKMKSKRSFHRDAAGKKVWDAWAGFDTRRFSLYDFYPNKLTVRKGDRVRWHFGHLLFEDHTASISKRQAIKQIVSKDFQFGCDPDGDGGAGPDGPPETQGFPFCNDPSHMEVDVAEKLGPPVGNGVYRGGSDLESSGVRGQLGKAFDSYTVRFSAVTDRKGTPYICAIHPFMQGRVRVKG